MDILYVTNVHRISKELKELLSFKDVIMNMLIVNNYYYQCIKYASSFDMVIIVISKAVS